MPPRVSPPLTFPTQTQGISLFMPTLLKGMGYGTIESQLRSVPPYVVACPWSIFIAYVSYRTQRRGIWILLCAVLGLAGSSILVGTGNKQADYAGLFLLAMGGESIRSFVSEWSLTRKIVFPLGPLYLTWANNNAAVG